MTSADDRYRQGLALHRQGDLTAAERTFEKIVRQKPAHFDALHMLGLIAIQTGRPERGVEMMRKAIRFNPKFTLAHNNLGNMLVERDRFEEAIASFDKAIALQPDLVEAHFNRGHALRGLERPAEAIASYAKAIALRPDYADAYWNQSLCHLQMGDFETGWRLHEWRKRKDQPIAARTYEQKLWLGEPDIAGKTLLIHCEQGLGDTIQLCRYAKLAVSRDARVVMEVQAPLQGLLRQLGPAIRIVNPREAPGAFDYHCPMFSLPLAFGTKLETIPSGQCYLRPDPGIRALWLDRLGPAAKPRIGVVWRGNPAHRNDRARSIALTALRPLFSAEAQLVCLQKEIDPNDAVAFRQSGGTVFSGVDLRDFSDTAGLVDLMDLVITVDTAVAHLAAAMGKPVWILLPFNPDWRWLLSRDDSPWYPTARLFRQRSPGDWTGVVDKALTELAAWLARLDGAGRTG